MANTNQFNRWEDIDGSSVPQSKIDSAFKSVMSKAAGIESEYVARHFESKSRLKRVFFYAVAASIALVAIPTLSISIYKSLNNVEDQAVTMKECYAREGETKTLILQDSTKVVLNSGTAFIYPETFSGKARSVFLSGEACFDVTKDAKHPFIVKTSDITIKVHGTLFNVKAYPDDPSVKATLCRGSISAYRNGEEGRPVYLIPGQEYDYDKFDHTYSVKEVEASNATAWKNGDIFLEHEDIYGIVRIIQRRFNVHVYLTTDKYSDAFITAKFIHGESLKDMMAIVSRLIPGMKYKIINNNIYIQ